MHCGRFTSAPISRREMLARAASGFGAVALAALAQQPAFGAIASDRRTNPLAPQATHFAARQERDFFVHGRRRFAGRHV